jgi:acetyl esterase/lipase
MKRVLLALVALVLVVTTAIAQRKMPPPLPPGVVAHRNVEYVAGGGKPQSLDLFVPEKTGAALPLVVWIHGGAWWAGSKENCPAMFLLSKGYAVASLNYRLSQEAPWPAQIDDCKAAIRWLRAHAAAYNLDPAHIGVWGGSAGGHLVAMLGVTGDKDSGVQAVCDWFGPSDLGTMFDVVLRNQTGKTNSPIIQLLGGPGVASKEKAAQASPITFVSKKAAPFLIMHGDKDLLVPLAQSEKLNAALEKAGVDTKLVVVPGAGHGFGGPDIQKQVSEFFDKHLKSASR